MMITEALKKDVIEQLHLMIGAPWEDPDGCYRFVKKAFALIGVNLSLNVLYDARQFIKVEHAEFADIVITKDVAWQTDRRFHICFAEDERWIWQSAKNTGGVARLDMWRPILRGHIRLIARLKKLCS